MMKRTAGITLIEMLVVIAVIGTVLALAAPSFKDMILMQRLRSINSQLVTDLQFARAEAVSRRSVVRVIFMSTSGVASCYTVYTSSANDTACSCLNGPGAACTGTMVEIKTVFLPANQGVTVTPSSTMFEPRFAFDWRTGSLLSNSEDDDPAPLDQFVVEAKIDTSRRLETRLGQAGRPSVCTPAGATIAGTPCP